MSEAMSSVEIEDVLSSIRRLVSEDLRPGPKKNAAVKTDEKLLLTPALRVVDDVVATPAAPTATPLPRLHLGAEPVIEELAATLERAVEAQDVEWESEVGDPIPQVADMEWSENGWVVMAPTVAPAMTPDLVENATVQKTTTPAWAQDDADLDGEAPAEDERPIAEPDAYWADQAEAEAVAELREKTSDDLSATQSALDEMRFDEQVLRDLVRDLIRDELQGGLGERITRNVRKLVRAEIARALAAQDMD